MHRFIRKTKSGRQVSPVARAPRPVGSLFAVALILFFCWRAGATLPIPDQVIYGTVAIQNRAVTNNLAGTNVVLEAHRSSDNRLVASYRMGSASSQGKLFYVLRIPMEDAPAMTVENSQPDDRLVISVKKQNVVQFTSTNIPPRSGTALRLDFGASVDTDGDGIPDAWELARAALIDSDGDGVPDAQEYLAGTDPDNSGDLFQLFIEKLGDGNTQVSFQARSFRGASYLGMTRYYALEATTNLAPGSWQALPNYDYIEGANQLVTYTSVGTAPLYFRGRVWLEGETGPDSNHDGVPDNWEMARLSDTTNGLSYNLNYIAGTDPANPGDGLRVIGQKGTNGQFQVSFHAVQATGVGYEGRTRYYALETTTNLAANTWRTVPNYTRVVGTNQFPVYNAPPPPSPSIPAYYRARVWLEGP